MEIDSNEPQSWVDKLMWTDGWKKLTPTQQKIIIASLSITQRAYSRQRPIAFIDLDNITPPNVASQKHIASEYCHTAIAALEIGRLVTNPHAEESLRLGKHFFDSKDFDLTLEDNKRERLTNALKEFEFPCVVQPGVDPKIIRPAAVHSFLALGEGPDGQIYCWDKAGLGMPYRVWKLDEEYEQYGRYSHWGIRKLRNTSTIST